MTCSSAVIMVLKDMEVQYCAVRKLILYDFVWKKMFPLTKKNSIAKAVLNQNDVDVKCKVMTVFHGRTSRVLNDSIISVFIIHYNYLMY